MKEEVYLPEQNNRCARAFQTTVGQNNAVKSVGT